MEEEKLISDEDPNINYIDKHNWLPYPMFGMQVSIYMDPRLVQQVDQKARRSGKSRSEFIEEIVQKEVTGKEPERQGIMKCFGMWDKETADKMLKDIYSSRMNSDRFK